MEGKITKSALTVKNYYSDGSMEHIEVTEAPAGYVFTGECRRVKYGERYLSRYYPDTVRRWGAAAESSGKELILRKLETARERRAQRIRKLFPFLPVPDGAHISQPVNFFENAIGEIERIFEEEKV